jgi:hypothetical protein
VGSVPGTVNPHALNKMSSIPAAARIGQFMLAFSPETVLYPFPKIPARRLAMGEDVCGMSQRQFYNTLVSYGIPGNDAGLIGYGALRQKSFTWQNDEAVTPHAVSSANSFLASINAGIKVSVSEGRWGKTIWEVTVLR